MAVACHTFGVAALNQELAEEKPPDAFVSVVAESQVQRLKEVMHHVLEVELRKE